MIASWSRGGEGGDTHAIPENGRDRPHISRRVSCPGDRRREGGPGAFFSHGALTAVAVLTLAMIGVGLFSDANLSSGEREDRGNRWVIAALGVLGLAGAIVPALTDRFGLLVLGGERLRWLGVVVYALGGALRLAPTFALGERFSGLAAIQPGHRLKTEASMRSCAIRAISASSCCRSAGRWRSVL